MSVFPKSDRNIHVSAACFSHLSVHHRLSSSSTDGRSFFKSCMVVHNNECASIYLVLILLINIYDISKNN